MCHELLNMCHELLDMCHELLHMCNKLLNTPKMSVTEIPCIVVHHTILFAQDRSSYPEKLVEEWREFFCGFLHSALVPLYFQVIGETI